MPLCHLVYVILGPVLIIRYDQVQIAVSVEVGHGHSSSITQTVNAIGSCTFNKAAVAQIDQQSVSLVSIKRTVTDEGIAVEIAFFEGLV